MTTVLLVEDDDELRDEYESSLMKSGFAVITAGDGTDIERVMSTTSIDIIVSDTNLPTCDGDIACRHLLAQGRVRDVFVVAMSDDRDCERYWQGIAHDFLYKGGIKDLGSAVKTRYKGFIC